MLEVDVITGIVEPVNTIGPTFVEVHPERDVTFIPSYVPADNPERKY